MRRNYGKFFSAARGHRDSKSITTTGEGTSLAFGDGGSVQSVQITLVVPEEPKSKKVLPDIVVVLDRE
jgi:hypothetical protein